MTVIPARPVWSTASDTSYAGQYPLSVETFVARRVAELIPGITSITPHARYYPLHAYVAMELEGRPREDPIAFLRRCEVVFCAISCAHQRRHPELHQGLAGPHGGDSVGPYLDQPSIPIEALAAREQATGGVSRYSGARRGFLGQYAGSESQIGLTEPSADREIKVGPHADRAVISRAFKGLADLARQPTITQADLETHARMCVCGEGSEDRAWLRTVFIPQQAPEESNSGRRGATLRLLHRLIELHEPDHPERDLPALLVADPATFGDPTVAALSIGDAWRGVILRNWFTGAWRDLWGWIVNDVFEGAGRVEHLVSEVTDRVVAEFGDRPVSSLIAQLPESIVNDQPNDADDPRAGPGDLSSGCHAFRRLLIGASRVGRLPERVGHYFDNPRLESRNPQLTPTWLSIRLNEQRSRPVSAFTADLMGVLLHRAQRVSLAKTRFANGHMQIPGTLSFRDGYVLRVDREGSGTVIMRWQQAVQVVKVHREQHEVPLHQPVVGGPVDTDHGGRDPAGRLAVLHVLAVLRHRDRPEPVLQHARAAEGAGDSGEVSHPAGTADGSVDPGDLPSTPAGGWSSRRSFAMLSGWLRASLSMWRSSRWHQHRRHRIR